MTSRSTGRTSAAALLAVLALLVAGLASPATAATATGRLTGVVTLDGKPVVFAKVQIYLGVKDVKSGENVSSTRLRTDNTDGKGRYSFSGLRVRPGYNYAVVVTDRPGRIVKATRRVVPRRGRTTTKNVHVKKAAVLRGVVTTADGRSPAGLTVGIDPVFNDNQEGAPYGVFYPEDETTVGPDGSFTLTGLPAGSYGYLSVSDDQFARRCYDFATAALADCNPTDPTLVGRQRLVLAAGDARTLPTVTMTTFGPPSTRLAGRVTDTSGKPLKGIRVSIDGAVERSTTRSSGRFTSEQRLREGPHTIRFDDPKGVWASQYLGGGPDLSGRPPVTVMPGQAVSGLDTRLKSVATAKIASKAGTGSAKVAFQIKRRATGGRPGGTITLSLGSVTRTVSVRRGRATVTLTGLPRGLQSLVAHYSGTGSTAEFSKTVRIKVR